jgi:transglutaminase-like putative cysteine protease
MRLTIHHRTHYQYENAPTHMVQLLRLTPRDDAHQRVIEWKIVTPGRQTVFRDAFQNVNHTHVVHTPQDALEIEVNGVVEMQRLVDGELREEEGVPPIAYLCPTDLTQGSPALDALAPQVLAQGLTRPVDALMLAAAICRDVRYRSGQTDVNSTAAEAFAQGAGVCQDHAHVMIAACRSVGVAARYVSGYVDPGSSRAAASHAWVDVWLFSRWISVDVTNGVFASDGHCRLAVGRDYLDACPIRGVRDGGREEQLEVTVSVGTTFQQ